MNDKRYTEEFMQEAVRLDVEQGYSVAEVAGRLGTTPPTACMEDGNLP